MSTITPYDWQQPSVDKHVAALKEHRFALDTSDTGTGKTVIALATAKQLGVPTLVICPKAVHTAWRRTADAMDVKLIDVINPEKLRFKNPYYDGKKKRWSLVPETLIIWDEIHKGASGPKSQLTQIAAYLKPHGYYVLAMSATVAYSPLQMRVVGYYAGMHRFLRPDFYNWCRRNGCVRNPFSPGSLMFTKSKKKADEALADINKELQPYMSRIKSCDVPDFPHTKILTNLYDVDKPTRDEINRLYKAMLDLEEHESDDTVPAIVKRLRLRQAIEFNKAALYQELITDWIEENNSTVCFVNYQATLDILKLQLEGCGHRLSIIRGGQTDRERQEAIDGFNRDDTHICLCMIQAGGVGISLHALKGMRPRRSIISIGDKADELIQALGRIHRANGTDSIQTIALVAGTVEEEIQLRLNRKLKNIELINNTDLLGDEEDE